MVAAGPTRAAAALATAAGHSSCARATSSSSCCSSRSAARAPATGSGRCKWRLDAGCTTCKFSAASHRCPASNTTCSCGHRRLRTGTRGRATPWARIEQHPCLRGSRASGCCTCIPAHAHGRGLRGARVAGCLCRHSEHAEQTIQVHREAQSLCSIHGGRQEDARCSDCSTQQAQRDD